jgi:hypothetical protein
MRGGIDIGPSPSYWKLSYRRKLIRCCWMGPICTLGLALNQLAFASKRDLLGWEFVVLSGVGSAAYSVYLWWRWKHEERQNPPSNSRV